MSFLDVIARSVKPAASRWRDYMNAPIMIALQERVAAQKAAETITAPAEPDPPALEAAKPPPAIASAPNLKTIKSLDELDQLMARAAASGSEEARVRMLCEYVLDPASLSMPDDPFSKEYVNAVVEFHNKITGRAKYDPKVNELIEFDVSARAKRPSIYADGGSRHLGMFLEAFGQILKVANLTSGEKVLEYGPGDGQIAITLSRMGCEVTVVDIEKRYLDVIEAQCTAMGLNISCIHGEFMSDVGENFDCVIFFETFHHALNHIELLESLHRRIKPGGKIIFSGEPILPRGDYWEPVVPFPWGIRLDALSLQAIRNYGWMELGFQESYFLEVLSVTGWKCEKIISPTNGRGTCYVATAAVAT